MTHKCILHFAAAQITTEYKPWYNRTKSHHFTTGIPWSDKRTTAYRSWYKQTTPHHWNDSSSSGQNPIIIAYVISALSFLSYVTAIMAVAVLCVKYRMIKKQGCRNVPMATTSNIQPNHQVPGKCSMRYNLTNLNIFLLKEISYKLFIYVITSFWSFVFSQELPIMASHHLRTGKLRYLVPMLPQLIGARTLLTNRVLHLILHIHSLPNSHTK